MVRLYKDPNGDKIFTDPDASSSIIIGKNGAITWINDKMRISNLEAKISELESKMKNSLVIKIIVELHIYIYNIYIYIYISYSRHSVQKIWIQQLLLSRLQSFLDHIRVNRKLTY